MSTSRIATIPRTTPGRPRDLRKKVEEIIGTAGYAALMEADTKQTPEPTPEAST